MSDPQMIKVEFSEDDGSATLSVPCDLYDLTSQPLPGLAPGFYYNIPLDPETGKVSRNNEVVLAGPYDDREAAVAAANAFLLDAINETAKEMVELA